MAYMDAQKWIVSITGGISGIGYILFVIGWSLFASELNEQGSEPKDIVYFPFWFFLVCGPAVYITLIMKTVINFKTFQWKIQSGLQIAHFVLLLLYVIFGGMNLYLLGLYVDVLNNVGTCSYYGTFCSGSRLTFSGSIISVLLLIIMAALNNDLCLKNLQTTQDPASDVQVPLYNPVPVASNFVTYQPVQAFPMQPGAVPMQQVAVPMQPGAVPMQQVAVPMQPAAKP